MTSDGGEGVIIGRCRHKLTWKFCRLCKDKPKPRNSTGGIKRVRTATTESRELSMLAHVNTQCPWCVGLIVEGQDWLFKRAREWVCEDCAHHWDEEHK